MKPDFAISTMRDVPVLNLKKKRSAMLQIQIISDITYLCLEKQFFY